MCVPLQMYNFTRYNTWHYLHFTKKIVSEKKSQQWAGERLLEKYIMKKKVFFIIIKHGVCTFGCSEIGKKIKEEILTRNIKNNARGCAFPQRKDGR